MQPDLPFEHLTVHQQSLHRHRAFRLLRKPQDPDFMSLAKRLQRELTVIDLPWTPPRDPQAGRLINDIVLAEKSDLAADGRALSHYGLYLQAMQEFGADSSTI